MKRSMKIVSLILVLLLALSGITGCGNKENGAGKSTQETASTASPQGNGLPIVQKPLTLTWFVPLYNSNVLKSANDQYCWQEIQKRTGITIQFIHPPVGSESDTFNVRLASGDLTDIITWNWLSYAGGPTKAVSSNVIVKLNDQIKQNAPNYSKLLSSIKSAEKNATLGDGTAYGFVHAVPDPIINSTAGFMIRKDWLDKLNLKVPATIDEWYTALKAFKEKDPNGNGKPDEIPYVSDKGATFKNLAAAWGIRTTFFPNPKKDGKISFGPIEPEYKEFLATMAKWYSEGLIDSEFPTNVRKNIDEKVASELAGTLYGSIGSQLGTYNLNGQAKNSKFELVGINEPAAKDGKVYSNQDPLSQGMGNQSTTISSKNKNVTEAVKLIDYLYSEEGRTLLNWGKEEESYTKVNGKIQYTDLIMKNPNGLSKLDAVAKYAVPIFGYFSSFYLDSYSSINLSSQQQKEAANLWAKEDYSLLKPVMYPTEEESSQLKKIENDINTYVDEMLLKFVLGKEPISNFDDYVKRVKSMDLDTAIKLYQAMYDRSMSKK